MKKYYFQSGWRNLGYLPLILFHIGVLIFEYLAKDENDPVVGAIIVSYCCVFLSIILFWIGFSFTMRIQIDYEKKELYIRYPYFLKRLKFDDVLSIQIKDYNELVFSFIIVTKDKTKKLNYPRYYKKKPTEERLAIVNELKQDLMNISNRNYC